MASAEQLARGNTSSASTTVTTSSVTVADGDLLVLALAVQPSTTPVRCEPTVAGLNVTWERQDDVGSANQYAHLELWRGVVTSSTTGTATVSLLDDSANPVAAHVAWHLIRLSDADTANNGADAFVQTVRSGTSIEMSEFSDPTNTVLAFWYAGYFPDPAGVLGGDLTEVGTRVSYSPETIVEFVVGQGPEEADNTYSITWAGAYIGGGLACEIATVESGGGGGADHDFDGTSAEAAAETGSGALDQVHVFGGTSAEAASEVGSGRIGGDDPNIGTPRDSAVWMVTGHSLSEGVSAFIALLAGSDECAYDWQEQRVIGSPIRVRTSGMTVYPDQPENVWAGYATGINRDGGDLDLRVHFRNVAAQNGKTTADPYDFVFITERHDLPTVVRWEHTVPLTRHYYELVREGSPSCVGYLYGTWLRRDTVSVADWVQHAREQQSATAALASRINLSLEYESRSDRLLTVPTASALGNLVELATTGAGLSGITEWDGESIDEEATMDVIFSDEVHPTDLGRYFLGCVCFSTLYRRDCRGLARPDGMSEATAESLQQVAWDSVVEKFQGEPLGEHYDQTDLKAAFVAHLELSLTISGTEDGLSEATSYYSGTTSPLHFNSATDAGLWFAPPDADADHSFQGTSSEAASEVGSGALVQGYPFSGASVEAASETGDGEFGYGSQFSGVDAEAAAETGNGELAQSHVLTGTGIEAASEAGSGEIVQGYLFTGSGAEANTETGNGALQQGHVLAGTGVEAASEAGEGALLQGHLLTGSGAESGAEVGSGTLAQAHLFAGASVEAASEVEEGYLNGEAADHTFGGMPAEAASETGSGALAQHQLLAGNGAESTAETGFGALLQGHLLVGSSVEAASETGSGELADHADHEFGGVANDVLSETGAPLFRVRHVFAALGAESASATGIGALPDPNILPPTRQLRAVARQRKLKAVAL